MEGVGKIRVFSRIYHFRGIRLNIRILMKKEQIHVNVHTNFPLHLQKERRESQYTHHTEFLINLSSRHLHGAKPNRPHSIHNAPKSNGERRKKLNYSCQSAKEGEKSMKDQIP